ncbi:hypothetical protein [Nitrospira sp. BLG_1]|uniref:hypothetical protein n=1 Tax=Nitrospira sp. BLG_1 TaxID=3395883 RepID=UPI0039BC2EE6
MPNLTWTREQYEKQRMMDRRGEFLAAIHPLIDLKLRIMNSTLPRIILSGDGPAQYEWPPAVQEQWAKIDESIEQIKEMMERRLHTQWIG